MISSVAQIDFNVTVVIISFLPNMPKLTLVFSNVCQKTPQQQYVFDEYEYWGVKLFQMMHRN